MKNKSPAKKKLKGQGRQRSLYVLHKNFIKLRKIAKRKGESNSTIINSLIQKAR